MPFYHHPTALGTMVFALDGDSLTHLSFGDMAEDSIQATTDAGAFKVATACADYLSGQGAFPEIPLAPVGTAFQQAVWQSLREIPFGETRSYSQLAAMAGRPAAIRAAASSCADNKIALLIPCHRVVAKNGTLGGYRWGLARKKSLLQLEKGTLSHVV